MSTRSCIARAKGDDWEGVYCHSYGYPTNRGPGIWNDLKENFRGDVEAFLKDRIDGHPGGWSSFPKSCYCHDPQHAKDGPMVVSSAQDNSIKPLFIEWVYVLAPKMLTIFKSVPTGKTQEATNHYGDKYLQGIYRWTVVVGVPLGGEEPDWKEIKEMGDLLSERAYKALEVKA